MKFDSEDQKKLALSLIGKVPVQTNIDGLFSGPGDDLRELIVAMSKAKIEAPVEVDDRKPTAVMD